MESRLSASIFRLGEKYYGEDGSLLSGDLLDQLLDSVAYNFNKRVTVTRKVNSVFDRISAHTSVPSHDHVLTQFQLSAKLRVNQENSRLYCGSSWYTYYPDGCHGGTGDRGKKIVDFNAIFNYNAGFIKLKTEAEGVASEDIEVYPTHDTIPVQVYVGGRKKEYERVFF